MTTTSGVPKPDAVAGRPVDPDRSPPDHAEALRTHRLATAVARSAASGAPEQVA